MHVELRIGGGELNITQVMLNKIVEVSGDHHCDVN